ncbi:hypothetical protein HanXRQr2_Chr09g0394391 [Helianthus annuus]|uniref:Uncharacterized protein n=1 Tax=Helianthus annuus TaxID=4232 RepID=A0A9K3I6J1_HELAN|nr:hypothetical protein HanXRQr2_Chr09g0394391 [Helianthus annuus]KAJ0893655.1 hypothetical protein HanPSC8_Chr09g0380251 [Helianthus annuus]
MKGSRTSSSQVGGKVVSLLGSGEGGIGLKSGEWSHHVGLSGGGNAGHG